MSYPYGPGPQYPHGFHYGQQPQFGYPQPGMGWGQRNNQVSSAVNAIGWVLVLLSLVVAVAAFLPWVVVGDESYNGFGGNGASAGHTDTHGMVTLILAVFAGLFAILRATIRSRSAIHIFAVLAIGFLGLVVTGFGIHDLTKVNEAKDALERSAVTYTQTPDSSNNFGWNGTTRVVRPSIEIDPGAGLYLTAIGGGALMLFSFVGLVKSS